MFFVLQLHLEIGCSQSKSLPKGGDRLWNRNVRGKPLSNLALSLDGLSIWTCISNSLEIDIPRYVAGLKRWHIHWLAELRRQNEDPTEQLCQSNVYWGIKHFTCMKIHEQTNVHSYFPHLQICLGRVEWGKWGNEEIERWKESFETLKSSWINNQWLINIIHLIKFW